ncbi:hypothetical protein A0256_12170 [Mucilaginibacter sp. PAMC 26640]|nr:hypothetical protein A0256_05420 [Mucilaginibacter sp. PAMC 26640]AMR32124.1 hypothetical protein A0256_12170 [Mucilaginibacter sp. PAMC 26640]
MKTQIFTIATIFTLALGTVSSTFAGTNDKAKEEVTTLNNVSQISRIEIRGNVQLFVSDGSADQVKVYNKFYAENAVVKSDNGTLSIASYDARTLVVWVTAADLRTINAYDNAEVKSFGNLSKIDLDVNLYNNASAKLNLDAYKASITVNDRAKADVSGTVTEYSVTRDQSASVNASTLAATNKTEKVTNKFTPAKNEVATL